MIRAKGEGQSECFLCKQEGKFALNWTSFLFKTEIDNYKNLYCYEHCKILEGKNKK